MTSETRKWKWRWLRHVAWVLAAKVFLIVLALIGVAIFFGSGAGNPIIQRFIVHRLETVTGGHVALKAISIRWLSLEVTLKGLVIHGREPAGTEPLFSAAAVEGSNLRLALDASGAGDHPLYLGTLDWQSINFTAKRFVPWPVGVSAKFTLRRDGFTLEQGVLTAGRSRLDAQAEMQDYAQPKWHYRYRGW